MTDAAASDRYSEDYAAEHGRFTLVPAVYVVLRRGDDVLLQLRTGTGYYDRHWAAGAAGHLDQGETMLEGAVREAAEELGVAIDPADLTVLTVMQRTDAADPKPVEERLDVFFECRRWGGEPHAVESKAAEVRWFALDALPEPIVPHERVVIERLAPGTEPLPPLVSFGFDRHVVAELGSTTPSATGPTDMP